MSTNKRMFTRKNLTYYITRSFVSILLFIVYVWLKIYVLYSCIIYAQKYIFRILKLYNINQLHNFYLKQVISTNSIQLLLDFPYLHACHCISYILRLANEEFAARGGGQDLLLFPFLVARKPYGKQAQRIEQKRRRNDRVGTGSLLIRVTQRSAQAAPGQGIIMRMITVLRGQGRIALPCPGTYFLG